MLTHRFLSKWIYARLLIGLSCTGVAAAQSTTGVISGTVQDASQGAISGAKVSALRLDTGARRSTLTGQDGHYTLPAMPVGEYEVRAEQQGFQTLVHKGLRLTVGQTAVIHFTLPVGELRLEVTVVAKAPLANSHTHELSYLVGSRSIEELPLNGRNYLDLMLLQPGVQPFRHRDSGGSIVAHGLGVSVNGQDPRSNVYLLDGTPQNDFTNGPAGSGAGTSLGMETIREFRVEVNGYSAEFGRNFGGQINALTKSGTNRAHGSLFHYLRNDNLDARNFFDTTSSPPEFRRNQFGAVVGGPIRRDRTFFFLGYEGLREDLGRTISTVVPDENARAGLIPDPQNPQQLLDVGVDPDVKPYLDEFPLPNAPNLGGGLAPFNFGFTQELVQDFFQARVDHNFTARDSFFARYTLDDAGQRLPTDFPQFPRSFVSRNQFLTLEHRRIFSPKLLNTFRAGFSRTRIGQDVEANTTNTLEPFVLGRPSMGDIDIGGIPRFGPQVSANVQLTQNVFSFQDDVVYTHGRHSLKFGGLAERYQDNLFNPTFSRGIFAFANIGGFLRNQPLRFIGLTPESTVDRYWRFSLFGLYVQDDFRATSRLTLNLGLRYEFSTVPREIQGRDTALLNLDDAEPTLGQVYENPTKANLAPRLGFAWDVFGNGSTALRGGYGLFFNTNNQQNLIVTVVNPPSARRPVIGGPVFPQPSFDRAADNSIRPIEFHLKNPYIQSWNLNLQRELWAETLLTIGYAGARGIHLLRNTDANTAVPEQLADGRYCFPVAARPGVAPCGPSGAPGRRNPNFSTIELKKSDGNSWYNALIVELRKRFSHGVQVQSSYTFSRSIDTTQASTFFSDSVTGTTSAMPELPGLAYNRGLSDFHAPHTLVSNFVWELPFPSQGHGPFGAIFGDWQAGGLLIVQSGNPLTAMVQRNRSGSLWSPTVGPGRGVDRPSLASGFTHESAVVGDPARYFNPAAFLLQQAGTLGSLGRNVFIGPDLRAFDFSLAKNIALSSLSESGKLQFRVEFFNLFNCTNFAAPAIVAFAGVTDGEAPLSSFGRTRSTVTSSRQIQFGLRLSF